MTQKFVFDVDLDKEYLGQLYYAYYNSIIVNFDQRQKDCIHLWNVHIEPQADLNVMGLNDRRNSGNYFHSNYNSKVRELHNEIYKN